MACLVSTVVVLKTCKGRVQGLGSVYEVFIFIFIFYPPPPVTVYFEIEIWTQFLGDFLSCLFSSLPLVVKFWKFYFPSLTDV